MPGCELRAVGWGRRAGDGRVLVRSNDLVVIVRCIYMCDSAIRTNLGTHRLQTIIFLLLITTIHHNAAISPESK
jgi:hypothetical protein